MDGSEIVSIIVPVYNAEKNLEKCIKSIMSQTYAKLEVLLINDGSTDKSLEIIKRYENIDSRIKYFNKKNSGVSSARNYGIEKAKGKFVFFIDADDTIDKYAIENLIKEYDETYLIGLNHCICKDNQINKRKYEKEVYDPKEFFESIFKGKSLGVVWGYLFETKFLKNISFDENTFYMEDTIFLLDFFKCSNVKKIKFIDNNNYYNYYINNESITASAENIIKKCISIAYSLNKINEKTENKYSNLIDINLTIFLEKEMRFCKNINEYKEIYKTVGKLNCDSKKMQIVVFKKIYNKQNFHILKLYYFIRNNIKKIKNIISNHRKEEKCVHRIQ